MASAVPPHLVADILQKLPEPAVLVDAGDRIVYANQAAADLLGTAAETLIGQSVAVFRAHAARLQGRLSALLARSGPTEFDLPLETHGKRYLLLKVRPVELAGRQYRLGVAYDITRWWQVQSLLEAVGRVASAVSSALEPHALVEHLARELNPLMPVRQLSLVALDGDRARVLGSAHVEGSAVRVRPGSSWTVVPAAVVDELVPVQPHRLGDETLAKLGGWLEVPGPAVALSLRHTDRPVGSLIISTAGQEPASEQLALLGALSEPLGVFLVHLLTVAQLQAKVKQQSLLLQLVAATTQGLPSVEVIESAVARVSELLRAQGAAIGLLAEPQRTLSVVGAAGILEQVLGAEISLPHEMLSEALASADLWMAKDLAAFLRPALRPGLDGLPCILLPLRIDGRLLGALAIVPRDGTVLDSGTQALLRASASLVAEALYRSALIHDADEAYLQTVMVLKKALDARDSYTAAHSEMVADVAEALGRALHMDDASLRELRFAALLHDIGKVAVPDAILRKPGPLTPEEWEAVRRHPLEGERILGPLKRFRRVALYVRHHHERWDGTGYPDGLRGNAIPLASRIIAVVDAFFAIVSHRSYRPGRTLAEALLELEACAGTQFDPEVVRAFLRLVRSGQIDIPQLVRAHQELRP